MNILKVAVGFLLGVATAVAGTLYFLPKKMLTVHKSRLGFDETVTAVQEEAEKRGWNVPKVYDIQTTLAKADHTDMNRIKIVSICQPHHAYKILKPDDNKFVAGMMPCRVGIFETEDGDVYVSEMNLGLMSKLFSPSIRDVMGIVAAEEQEMISGIVIE